MYSKKVSLVCLLVTIIKNNILKPSHSVFQVAQGLRAANDVQGASAEAARLSHATMPETAQQAMFDLLDMVMQK